MQCLHRPQQKYVLYKMVYSMRHDLIHTANARRHFVEQVQRVVYSIGIATPSADGLIPLRVETHTLKNMESWLQQSKKSNYLREM